MNRGENIMIIAAFAGVGKTYFCENVENSKDLVCMPFKYFLSDTNSDNVEFEKLKGDASLDMNLEYPVNYINEIKKNMDKYKYLIIPSDRRVLKGLKDKHIPYILCYPESVAKEEYKRRYG